MLRVKHSTKLGLNNQEMLLYQIKTRKLLLPLELYIFFPFLFLSLFD